MQDAVHDHGALRVAGQHEALTWTGDGPSTQSLLRVRHTCLETGEVPGRVQGEKLCLQRRIPESQCVNGPAGQIAAQPRVDAGHLRSESGAGVRGRTGLRLARASRTEHDDVGTVGSRSVRQEPSRGR